MNIIITSPMGKGKTTCAEKLVEELRKAGMRVGGVLCPAKDMITLSTGERKKFLYLTTEEKPSGPTIDICSYNIPLSLFEWGNAEVRESLQQGHYTLIDEYGYIEAQRQEGLHESIKEGVGTHRCIILVRDRNLNAFFSAYPGTHAAVYSLTEHNRDDLHKAIARFITENL